VYDITHVVKEVLVCMFHKPNPLLYHCKSNDKFGKVLKKLLKSQFNPPLINMRSF